MRIVLSFMAFIAISTLLQAQPFSLVKDINQTSNTFEGSADRNTEVNGILYFSALTPTTGQELWKSDGTNAGTNMIKDILPGKNGSNPMLITNVNGTIFLVAYDGVNGIELWKTDGTATGTTLVKDIVTGPVGSSIQSMTNVNGTLFYPANDNINGSELWKRDGTAAGINGKR